MPDLAPTLYQYNDLPDEASFRILELLPGKEDDPVSFVLHLSDLTDHRDYEAISYTWGNAISRASFICSGKRIEATTNLHSGLSHLRLQNEPRFLWVDALCINQSNVKERGHQVKQMRAIYEQAKTVLIWLGRDSRQYEAKIAIDSIRIISDFLCQKLGIEVSELRSIKDPLYDILTKRRELLPLPNECEFSNDTIWKALSWFYSHIYFTRVWIIQEINVPGDRVLHCGHELIEWERVDLVAGYITMETAFSKDYGFTNAYCWWAASLAEISYSKSWIFMLYLASNFSCLDARDFIYGLRGLMKFSKGAELLDPDYNKSITEVYRDSVEAAFTNFENTDVLYYLGGTEDPSWVPRWNKPMLFRNPFRLTSGVPWRPTGETTPIWSVDKELSILSLSGITLGTIEYTESYNEKVFGAVMVLSMEGRKELNQIWSETLKTFENKFPVPLGADVLTAAAVSLSFGLDEKKTIADDHQLMLNFVAYLKIALEEGTFSKYISTELSEESESADGHAFGKPVWDFEYPESSLFITESGLIGCAISSTKPGDIVFAALGSAYPHVLRPDDDHYRIRGYSYVHRIMNGEKKDSEVQVLNLR